MHFRKLLLGVLITTGFFYSQTAIGTQMPVNPQAAPHTGTPHAGPAQTAPHAGGSQAASTGKQDTAAHHALSPVAQKLLKILEGLKGNGVKSVRCTKVEDGKNFGIHPDQMITVINTNKTFKVEEQNNSYIIHYTSSPKSSMPNTERHLNCPVANFK